MVVYQEFKDLKGVSSPVHWAMGMFDGLHLGHAGVIAAAVEGAARDGGIPAVLTFRTHPLARVRPESVPAAIMAVEAEKFALMEELGVRMVLNLEFSSRLASMSPEEFIGELCSSCRVAEIAVGEDWHFGRGRAGNVETLRLLAGRCGFRVTAVPPILRDGERVSSTRIREAVRAADFSQASAMLGRPYRWKGRVVHGRQLGRQLDYPTANMKPGSGVQPPHGVYAVRARVNGSEYGGVANLGVRPTVEEKGGELLLETHLFGQPGDIYGREMEVEPVRFLRPEAKFPSLEELKSQLARDAANAAEVLKREE
ncbi:riboflavin biosynthesis protein RibF [uncultured Akkermansia sp.]|uniref:riboflavin biosynthesis protein RibF n=1 Tax=uncultured Akkermansia sp. TaxID=512294 RepID=UPI00265D3EDF|nr:riboflavin biosynthesis protein RibF [uncultured Akkermansia sp.]